MEFRYTAIILKKTDTGEADRLYVMYTREAGKMKAFARGVRKPHARLAAQLENFHRSQIIVMRSRGAGNIKSAGIEGDRKILQMSLPAMMEVFSVADFFDRSIGWEEPDPELFDFLEEYLDLVGTLIKTDRLEKLPLLRGAFLFKILSHLGHTLEVGHCVVSGETLSPGDHFVSVEQGGIVGASCVSLVQVRDIRKISMENIKLMRLILNHPLRSIMKVSMGENHIRSFLTFLKEYQDRVFR